MSRSVDLLIAYRVIKMLVTPFDKQPAFKYGIIAVSYTHLTLPTKRIV